MVLKLRGPMVLKTDNFWRLSAVTTGPGLLPRHIEHLHHDPALLVLPTRQSRRSYQSGQDKLSGYPRKR